MAPEHIVEQVQNDYVSAMEWLQDSALDHWERQWAVAPSFLHGAYLRRYQRVLLRYRSGDRPRFIGILRAHHRVDVAEFSDDGERCLVVDHQEQRRMATYDSNNHERVMTQDLGDRAVIYQMVFDKRLYRWKIESFIQELPPGWGGATMSRHVRLQDSLPTQIGRDS